MTASVAIHHGDSVAELGKLGDGSAALVVADPPYNQGMPYEAYADNLSYDAYMTWTEGWLEQAVRVLAKSGSIFVFIPDEWDAEIRVMLKRRFNLYQTNKIVWAFTFGQAARKRFTRAHCNILWFTKRKADYVFNAESVKVPSARSLVYKDKRAKDGGKLPDDVWMLLRHQLEPHMTPDRDVWLESRVCGTFHERRDYSPNQLPDPVVRRIVLACSNPGDLVVDPFLGTGVTASVASASGRRFWGCDLSLTCVEEARRRVAAAPTVGVSCSDIR